MKVRLIIRRINVSLVMLVAFLSRTVLTSPTAITTLNSSPHFMSKVRHAKAEEMQKLMNQSVDPCVDFYEFACGHYGEYMRPVMTTRLRELGYAMDGKIKTALEIYEAADSELDKQVKHFYRSCLSVADMPEGFTQQLRQAIAEFGQMPALEGSKWQEGDFDWLEVVAKIAHNADVPIILHAAAIPDFVNNTNIAAVMEEPPLNFARKAVYTDMQHRHKFLKLVIAKRLTEFLGIEEQLAKATAEEIFEFERALAEGMKDDITNVQVTDIYNLTSLENLQVQYVPVWDTAKLFDIALEWKPDQLYADHKYLQNALKVLKQTPKRIVANHIFYTYMLTFTFRVGKSKSEMEEKCLELTQQHFYKYLDNIIYRKYFTQEYKEIIDTMWQDIKITFQDSLQTPRLQWIQAETRQLALEKLKAMQMKINSYQDLNFTLEYGMLALKDNDYVHNMKAILTQQGDKARAKVNMLPLASDNGAASSFTPIYSETENLILIPVALLQPFYFWSTSYPHAYNFGSLGSYLAHELLHGFDDNGRNYDALGNHRNWWDDQSSVEFYNRTQCFVQQYKKYIFNDSPLPEMQLQAENIADNGGVRLAYEAYLRWYENSATTALEMEPLVDFNFTHRQLFFISYAQTWCSSENPAHISYRLLTDSHVPHKFRVIGPLSNFEEFAKQFQCLPGSSMNAATKCEIY